MKIAYTNPKNLRSSTQKLLTQITDVIDDYASQGFKLTLRQLYYQLVSADVIENKQSMYSKLSVILKDARMCGQVDWNIIEDRVRKVKQHATFSDINDLMEAAVQSYRTDRHEDQEKYVEVWVEKDALSGVLEPIVNEYHVPLMVNRGYSSVSAMHDAAQRFDRKISDGKHCVILYLGDHDPSGLDMIRDIESRLAEFRTPVTVQQIALTMEQIQEYNPPPNPAKISDPRASEYIEKYGQVSWELDALKPSVLHDLLRTHLNELIDMDRYDATLVKEADDIAKLRDAISQINFD